MERADFAAWCAAVCRHIRYRPARAQAAAELMDHLTDHAAALEDAGAAPEDDADEFTRTLRARQAAALGG